MTTPTTVQVQIQLRADTAANWTSENPVLLAAEVGLETDTKKIKVGDGITAWSSLAYFPSIVTGGTVLGNLEIGTTGTLTFEGSTANGFETTLAVTDPTADRTITLPDQSGTVVVTGNASIVDADIAADAEIAVSKLADGAARQLLQTDAAGTGVEWTDNVDVPGTLDVTGAATFDDDVTIEGDLTVNGTTTTVNTETLTVKDKNIELAVVDTPTDTTADGGGITLKGATDKTITWSDTTDAWTLSEHVDLASGKEYRINGAKVLDATSLGSSVLITSTNITDGTIVDGDINASAAIAGTKISPDFGAQTVTTTGVISAAAGAAATPSITFTGDLNTGIYSPGADQVAISNNGTQRLLIDANGNVNIDSGTVYVDATNNRVGLGTSAPEFPLDVAGSQRASINVGGFVDGSFSSYTAARILELTNGDSASIDSGALMSFRTRGTAGYLSTWFVGSRNEVGNATNTDTRGSSFKISQLTQNSSQTVTDRLVISRFGAVGIGDNAPGSTLTVKGATNATPLQISGPSSEFARIDSSGRLLVGTSSSRGDGSPLQVVNDSANPIEVFRGQSNAFGPAILLNKSRGTTASPAPVIFGDVVGAIAFKGYSGAAGAYRDVALISAAIDGEPDSSGDTTDMPGRLTFFTTADGASSLTERMRISSAGTTTLTSAASTAPLIAKIDTSEVARIDSSGRLLVGTASGDGLLQVQEQRIRGGNGYSQSKTVSLSTTTPSTELTLFTLTASGTSLGSINRTSMSFTLNIVFTTATTGGTSEHNSYIIEGLVYKNGDNNLSMALGTERLISAGSGGVSAVTVSLQNASQTSADLSLNWTSGGTNASAAISASISSIGAKHGTHGHIVIA